MIDLPTFEELRRFVHRVLAQRADLDDETPLLETTLYRRGRPCGIEYTLLAPRSCRLSAIWETLEHRILFYDENLERFQTTFVNGPSSDAIEQRDRLEVATKSMWRGRG